MVRMKDYNLTCGEVIDNLLMLADAYEKASAGKAPNGFAFDPTGAAANMKAAVHFIGSFGQQVPRWIPVSERLPESGETVLAWHYGEVQMAWLNHLTNGVAYFVRDTHYNFEPSHWMPLPEPPEVK